MEERSDDCELDCCEDEKKEEDKLFAWGLLLVLWVLLWLLVAVEADLMEERKDDLALDCCEEEKKEEDKLLEWGLLPLPLLSL